MENIREIYENYEKLIFRYFYGVTLDFYLAEELTQETFFQVVKSFHRFRGDSHVSTWLYKIARNVYREYCRKNSVKSVPIEENNFELLAVNNPEAEFERKEKNKILLNTLKQIPENQREVLWLRDWQELSYEEIAIITNRSLAWVKVNIHRGRLAFKKIYVKEDN